jgi:hypothetical protein
VISIIYGFTYGQKPIFSGIGFVIAANAIATLNFYLFFIRPRLFFLTHKSMDGYHFISGVPIIGTLFTIIGLCVGFGAIGTAIIGIIAILLDTGGSLYFLIAIWHDTSFWNS